MIMSLKNHIHIILIHQRCELCTKHHSVGIRMIITGSVDILMEYDDTPLGILILRDRFFHYILMGCAVVIVRIKHHE